MAEQEKKMTSAKSALLIVSLVALMACSHDRGESVEPEPEPTTGTAIVFSANQDEQAVTRATSLHSEGVSTFRVWAYKNISYESSIYTNAGLQSVMPNYTVNWQNNSAATTTTNSIGWEYVNQQTGTAPEQTIKYWDWGAKAYRFFGVTGWADVTGAEGTYGNSAEYKTYNITIAVDVSDKTKTASMPYFTQLWFSTGNKVEYPKREFGKTVELTFLKPYSKVRFMFNYALPREGLLLVNPTFKPTTDYSETPSEHVGIARKGDLTVSYPLTGTKTVEWYTTTPNSSADVNVSKVLPAFTEDYDPTDEFKEYEESDDGWYTVLPMLTQGSYTLAVELNNAVKTAVVPAEYMKWLPGYSYTYIFKINEQGGVEIMGVQTAFTPWTEMGGEQKVYNW